MATADLTYSRDDTVREIASYYDFLSTIYLPPAVIKRPPPGGWPEITSAYLGCLHKNEEVINLIRHLPFVQRDEYDDLYNIFSSTAAVDFTGELVRKKFASDSPLKAELVEPGKSYGDIPAHVLTLATPAEGRIGYYFLIDTERGTAVMCDLQVGPHPTELSQEPESERDEWRSFATYTIKDFFAFLKDQFRTFKVIAVNERMVFRLDEDDPDYLRTRRIYRQKGMLTEQYNREECIRCIAQLGLEY